MDRAKHILLVDDDPDDQLLFNEALKGIRDSLECEVAINGLDALEKMEKSPQPDAIFLDLNMPIMNGFALLSELKGSEKYKNIPVIVFTTSATIQDMKRCKKLGANLFLTKPSSFTALRTTLSKILSRDFHKLEFSQ